MKKLYSFPAVIELESVDSTNEYAKKLLNKGDVEQGTIVIAKSQLWGKGQDGNFWESEPDKNLTFSLILYPDFLPAEKQFQLNKIVSLAICDFVKTIVEQNKVSIKWPNDIYVDDKKAAGILIENTIAGNTLKTVVVGIGLNVNQLVFKSDAPNPVSLKNVTDKDFDLQDCLGDLYLSIENRYWQLKNNSEDIINQDYLDSLYRVGVMAKYEYNKELIEAKITGISPFGKLILETSDKNTLECDMKELAFIL